MPDQTTTNLQNQEINQKQIFIKYMDAASFLMRHQMVDDTGATVGPGELRGPVMGGCSRFQGGFGSGM